MRARSKSLAVICASLIRFGHRLTRINTDLVGRRVRALSENPCFLRVHPWLNNPFYGYAPRDRYRGSARLFLRDRRDRALGGPAQPQPPGILARWTVDPVVGGAGFDYRGRDERRYLSWGPGGGIQDARLRLRAARYRDGPRARGHRLHLHQTVLRLSRAEHLRVPHRPLRDQHQEHGERHFSRYSSARHGGPALPRGGDHGGDLALSFPRLRGQPPHLLLGHCFCDAAHDPLHRRGRN